MTLYLPQRRKERQGIECVITYVKEDSNLMNVSRLH